MSTMLTDAHARAVAALRVAGCEPRVPYPGLKIPWPSTHTCGRKVRPRLDSIRLGQGGCWICSARRYVPDLPGCFWLIESKNHPSFPSPVLKVGVTNDRAWTCKPRWKLLKEVRCNNGTVSLAIERAIVTWLMSDLGLEPVRSATGTTTKGFAEAISIVDLKQAGFTMADVVRRVMAVR